MDELISKQSAIDTSLEFFIEFLDGAFHENAQKELIARIQRLPSAQPDLDEWCTDCKEYDHEKHCCPRWNRVIRKTAEEVRQNAEAEQRWIPVEERLPEYGESVLCYYEDDDYGVNHIIDDEDGEWFIDGVVAWQPLPKPYERSEDE